MTINHVIMIFVEPTPYIRGFITACREGFSGTIKVFYLRTNASQSWALELDPAVETVLPPSRLAALRCIAGALSVRRGFSLLHLAGWGEPLFVSAMVLARARSIPVFVESDTWRKRDRRGFVGVMRHIAFSLLLRLPTHFLPGGSRQAALLSSYGVREQRITRAQMTVDVAAMSAFANNAVADRTREKWRQVLCLEPDETAFLFVGRLEPQKGLLSLVDAFSMLSKDRARLLIVGDGSSREEVERAQRRSEKIRYLGRLSGNELWATFVACDVLALPSTFEPWGLVVNEAMAFGLPVIVSQSVGCIDDLVTDGCEGLVVPCDDPYALSGAMHRFLDADFRATCAESARKRIADWTLAEEARIVIGAWRREQRRS